MQPDAVADFLVGNLVGRTASRRLQRPNLATRRVLHGIRWPIVQVVEFVEDCEPFLTQRKHTDRPARAMLGWPGPATRLRKFLATKPCDPECPGWFPDGETGLITRCDECCWAAGRANELQCERNPKQRKLAAMDSTILLLPEAVIELAVRVGATTIMGVETTTGDLARALLQSAVARAHRWGCGGCGHVTVGVISYPYEDNPLACAQCGAAFVTRVEPLAGLLQRRCVEHEDCRADWSLGRACWLRQGEAWAHLTDPRSVT